MIIKMVSGRSLQIGMHIQGSTRAWYRIEQVIVEDDSVLLYWIEGVGRNYTFRCSPDDLLQVAVPDASGDGIDRGAITVPHCPQCNDTGTLRYERRHHLNQFKFRIDCNNADCQATTKWMVSLHACTGAWAEGNVA